mgnify:CR=1 FL=1
MTDKKIIINLLGLPNIKRIPLAYELYVKMLKEPIDINVKTNEVHDLYKNRVATSLGQKNIEGLKLMFNLLELKKNEFNLLIKENPLILHDFYNNTFCRPHDLRNTIKDYLTDTININFLIRETAPKFIAGIFNNHKYLKTNKKEEEIKKFLDRKGYDYFEIEYEEDLTSDLIIDIYNDYLKKE